MFSSVHKKNYDEAVSTEGEAFESMLEIWQIFWRNQSFRWDLGFLDTSLIDELAAL